MKKLKKIIILIYLLTLILTLCGCSSNEKNEDIDKKIESEIQYLDKKIVGIMNKLNNITLDNYEVKSKEVTSENSKEGNEKQEGNKQNGESSGDNEASEQSSSKEDSGSGDSKTGSSENEQESNKLKVLQLQPSNILVINRDEVDWITIKSEVEIMYSTWNSILLDLYNMNIPNEDILGFSQSLDNAILAVKSEDKQKSLEGLAILYSYLPKYMEKIQVDESRKNILQAKSNIMKAYALVEQENWAEVQNQLNQADTAYSKVANDVKYIENKQEEVSRIYILIKELKNSTNLKDKDIFYIKYKNLMNTIN